METLCDNKSVGVIIRNEQNQILLIDRARFPFGLAAPAGHIDDHGGAEQAAINEVFEEVGLTIPLTGLRRVITDLRIENQCRRQGGNYHDWTVFTAENSSGTLIASNDEILESKWIAPDELQTLADKTIETLSTPIEKGQQLLEPAWIRLFNAIGILATNRER
jgi:8-oxo-dGTP pyrophosphatase MutT (NUDIX family)